MITFLGDIALLNSDITSQYVPEGDYMANCEYVCLKEPLKPTPGKIVVSSPYHDFKSIFGHNPVALDVANNHILDYGIEGFDQTIRTIHHSGISTVGDSDYWYNKSTCFLAYTLFNGTWEGKGIVSFSTERAHQDICKAKEKGAQCIVTIMHWGIENYSQPNDEQIKIGHWLIDEGVDLVIGHHPHCIQPIEQYKEHFIVYSLGNCIFPPFSVPSHFDEKGIAHRQYRFNWRRWNNKGLAVLFDEREKKLFRIDELYFKNNTLKCITKGVHLSKYLSMIHPRNRKGLFQLALRKYWLFLVSNTFVDGKLFDLNALKAEITK